MLGSLFQHNKNEEFNIYAIVENKSDKRFMHLSKLVINYNQKIEFLQIDISKLNNVRITHHISIATYFRLLLPEVLPININKVLFLDCDILVNKNIKELYNIDIENDDVAAVEELLGDKHKLLIGLNLSKKYFNAGILLINLERWRKFCYSRRFVEFLNLQSDRIIFWDQDVLNVVIEKRKIIEEKWNVMLGSLKEPLNYNFDKASIIHFTGSCKPWNCKNNVLSELYLCKIINNESKIIRQFFLKEYLYNCLQCLKNLKFRKVFRKIIFILCLLFKIDKWLIKFYDFK